MTDPARPYASIAVATPDQLFRRWRERRDPHAREELIERFLPLARKLANRYARSGEPFDDLVQVASVGLIKAVERFDPDQGNAFASFAVPTIVGELKRHFRDTTWTVQVDRRSQERARAVLTAQRMITAIGRSPTVAELADQLGWDPEEVLDGLQASLAYNAVSLDAPAPGADPEDGENRLFDTVGEHDERFERAEHRATLGAAVRHLPKLERRILYLRFGEDLSQREIASRVGISQMHVSRLLRRALAGLREQLGPTQPNR
jgi:RNA polymerase sigma-B factor